MPYRPPSQRSHFRLHPGAVTFCCLLLLIGGFVAFVWYDFNRPEPDAPKVSIEKPQADTAESDLEIDDNNMLRSKDAYTVTYAGGAFYRNNKAQYPTGFKGGALVGTESAKPSAVALKYYKEVLLADGAQKPVINDTIRFVSNASCAPSGSATVADTREYMYVVQYALQQHDGSFTAMCLKL